MPFDPNAKVTDPFGNAPQGDRSATGWGADPSQIWTFTPGPGAAGTDTQNAQPDWGPWAATNGSTDLPAWGAPVVPGAYGTTPSLPGPSTPGVDPSSAIGPGFGGTNTGTGSAAPAGPTGWPSSAAPPAAPSGPSPNVDLTQPGAGETFDRSVFSQPTIGQGWAQSQLPELSKPGVFEQFWQGQQGRFSGAPMTQNRADEAYNDWLGRRPDIAKDPGLGAYYDDAKLRANDTLSTEAAARGNYGSSVALGEVGKAIGGLEADRAKNEADYNLRRAAEIRAQGTAGGEMARGSDLTSQGNLDAVRSWLQTGGNIAQGAQEAQAGRAAIGSGIASAADAGTTSRATAGQAAASSSEGQRIARIAQLLGLDMRAFGDLSNLSGGTYGDIFSQDASLFGDQTQAPVAAASQGDRAQTQTAAQQAEALKTLRELLAPKPGAGGAVPT